MKRATENKIVLIVRKTRLDDLIARFNTIGQAQFYIEHLGSDFSDYVEEDATYKAAVQRTFDILSRFGRVQAVDRSFVPNFLFGGEDTVVVLGQDGLVANVLKYLDRQPVIGVNPDPHRWEGALLPFVVEELSDQIPRAFSGRCRTRDITMAKATLNTGQILHGVNDLFIGPKTHASARYSIQLGDTMEHQSSSGVIVSTGLGSTGWFRSILTGAAGIISRLTGKPSTEAHGSSFSWDSDYLYFSVREPWPSTTTSADLTFGVITPQSPLRLVSAMPEHGVIFSDGVEADYLEFNSGTHATLTVAEKKGCLVVSA